MSKKQPASTPADQQDLQARNVRDDDCSHKESREKPCSGDKPHC